MELVFLLILIGLMAYALGVGYPVAFALPGAAIITVGLAALSGHLIDGDVDAYFAHGGPTQWLSAGVTNFRGIYWEAERDTLIAIPLFVFMGIMLQRSKIAEDLLVTMAQLFGRIPGGLGISVVFVGALLAATTGIVGATVVAMGLISLPAMLRNNYSPALATGTIAASGTLGQIIPPSIVLIILADQLASATDQAGTIRQDLYKDSTGDLLMPSDFSVSSTSAGEMFLGAFLPGLVLVGLYMLFILGLALVRPAVAPAVHHGGVVDRRFFGRVFIALVPPLALIFLVLGSILAGIATVNQAGAIGAIGALMMAGYKLREGHGRAFGPAALGLLALLGLAAVLGFQSVNVKLLQTREDVLALVLAAITVSMLLIAVFWSGWRTYRIENTLRDVMIETAKTTSLVFIILLGAAMLTSAFRAFGGEDLVKDFLQSLPGGFWSQFIVVMAVIFILGFFLDFIEIAVVVVPIVAPILLADPSANITAVWLGVMIGLNIQTSFLTPPFGFALFYLRGVAPAAVKTLQMYKGVVAFIGLQLLALVIVGLYPALVNYLPNRVSLLADTAPPPKNPTLQYCMENHLEQRLAADEPGLRAAIAAARATDLSALPPDVQRTLQQGFDSAGTAIDRFRDIRTAAAAVVAATPGYRPLHEAVRALERDARRLDARIKDLEIIVRRAGPTGIYSEAEGAAARADITALTAERDGLLARIPDDWAARHKQFDAIQTRETRARTTYRRMADTASEPLAKTIALIRDAEALAMLRPQVTDLASTLDTVTPAAFVEQAADVRKRFNPVAGASKIRSAINGGRRAMRNRDPDPATARAALDKALALIDAEIAWRRAATPTVLPRLQTYQAAIADTIGLRSQPVLPRSVALAVAACKADHRDISLSF